MWGGALLNPLVDTLMIRTINADGFNGPLSECLSCSAALNNNFFVPQEQHGQKAHFLILRGPAARAAVLTILLLGRKSSRATAEVGRWPVLRLRLPARFSDAPLKHAKAPCQQPQFR